MRHPTWQRAMHLEAAVAYYIGIGRGEDVERLKREVSAAWRATDEQGEFERRSIEIELPMEEVKQHARDLLTEGLDVALKALVLDPEYTPNLAQSKRTAQEVGETHPLQRLITMVTLDGSRQIHRADSAEKSEEAELSRQYSIGVGIAGMMLVVSLEVFRQEGGLEVDTLVSAVRRICYVEDGQLDVIKLGLERYFDGDYASALHILVPQLEDVLRGAASYLGGTTTSVRGGVTTEKDLGQILETPELLKLFGADVIYNLQHTFTEQLGLNLRNRVSHGLVRKVDCTGPNCALVIHAFLRVAACEELRAKEDDGQDPTTL